MGASKYGQVADRNPAWLWNKIAATDDPGECWEWQGKAGKAGTGKAGRGMAGGARRGMAGLGPARRGKAG